MSHDHYKKSVKHLDMIDVYRVIELFDVPAGPIDHAVKKLLCAGARGHKDLNRDIQDAIDSLQRWQDMRQEDTNRHAMTPGYIEYPDVPDPDDWIPWSGGECPVDRNAKVRMKWRNGTISENYYQAGIVDWHHGGSGADIIAYRVLD